MKKISEELISINESSNTIDLGRYFAILQNSIIITFTIIIKRSLKLINFHKINHITVIKMKTI